MEMREFVLSGRTVLDLSFINKDLSGVCGIVYSGEYPIVNISSMPPVLRDRFYPGAYDELKNWGLLDGKKFSKVNEAEAALFETAKDSELKPLPVENSIAYVSLIQSAPRSKKAEWLGTIDPTYPDEYRRENGKPLLKGYDLEVVMENKVSLLRRGQV